jgi:WXXGXW repeat (2 copies)
MNRKTLLRNFGLAALLALPLTGCMVRGSGGAYVSGPSVAVVEVESEPPPPRVVHYDSRPGFIYIDGRWDWRGGQWVWRDGYYERERAGYIYAPGRWQRRGRGHVWVEGRWDSHGGRNGGRDRGGRDTSNSPGGTEVRDHRGSDSSGPDVRDHR